MSLKCKIWADNQGLGIALGFFDGVPFAAQKELI